MSVAVTEVPGPMSSGEIPTVDPDRADDIEFKQHLLAEFMERENFDAVLLEHPASFAWFTSGGDSTRSGEREPTAFLFITPHARVVICRNSDTVQVFDHELPGLGFQLKERPWTDSLREILADLCRGRQVASDSGFPKTKNVSEQLRQFRLQLTPFECRRMRILGRNLAHALEATGRGLKPGRVESEIAGEIAHRLIKHQIVPRRLQVLADARGRRFRHWSFDDTPIKRWCTVLAVGSRWGLCVGVSRTIAFGQLDPLIVAAFHQATMLTATAARFAECGWKLADTMDRVRRIYEKADQVDEWRVAPLGGIIAYEPCEVALAPRSDHLILPNTGLFLHPTVGPAVAAESILTLPDGFEMLTPTEQWPTVEVNVKDATVKSPGILMIH
jgi:Xaa-Pro dipeptidase